MTQQSPLSKGDGKVTPIRRVTSYSIEAEQSVLGGLLLDNSAWPQVAGIIAECDFYQASHRLIFNAIRQLAEQGVSTYWCRVVWALGLRGFPRTGSS